MNNFNKLSESTSCQTHLESAPASLANTVVESDLHYLEIAELASRIATREISPIAVTRAMLDRIAALDGALGSYALVSENIALAQAETAEAEIAAGNYRGVLHGVPVGVKDLFWTKNIPTAAGMKIHKDYRPTEDATVVRRLTEAGGVLLGKLQMTEGAYSDHHPSVTPPKNPWNPDYWPGISSSGPGAALAAGLCYGALASDTGGSIRWPSAANGVTGLKPSWGRVSRHGVFDLAPSLDHVGTMARSVVDAGALLGVIAGSDPNDPTAVLDPVPNYLLDTGGDIRGMRIGIDPVWNGEDVDAATQTMLTESIEVFRSLGAEIVEVKFPDVTQVVANWVHNCAVEAAIAHESTWPEHKHEYGSVLTSVIETGRAFASQDYHEILLRRLDLRGQVARVLQTIDLLLTPVIPFPPPTMAMIATLGEQAELVAKLQRYTCVFNMTGSPTLTLPGGFTRTGMPMAFQLVAADLDEMALVRAGRAFQNVTSWHRGHPVAMP